MATYDQALPDSIGIWKMKFMLHTDAPEALASKWRQMKALCEGENTQEKEAFVWSWLRNCKRDDVRALPYLKRWEGGIGGDNNQYHKQIRFVMTHQWVGWRQSNDIEFFIYNTPDQQWTYGELQDLMKGFVEQANIDIGGRYCVDGFITLEFS